VRLKAHGYEIINRRRRRGRPRQSARRKSPISSCSDIMMPKLDGISVLKELKATKASASSR